MEPTPMLEGIRKSRLYSGGLAPRQKRRILELLQRNFDRDLKLSTLAGECGLSVSHFARSFKKSFGVSAHRYLMLQRVEMAKAFLLRSRKALSHVAVEAGFPDQAAFSRTFGTIVGQTPRKWRNQHSHCLPWPGAYRDPGDACAS